MGRLCISNALLVTPSGESHGGVLVGENGRIQTILRGDDKASAETRIDARKMRLFAGFIDTHVHMRDPGFPHKEEFGTGSMAAACGGVTTVMCMPNTAPPVDTLEGFEVARAAGTGRSFVDFTLQAAITRTNAAELPNLWNAGVTSFEGLLSEGPENFRFDDQGSLMDVLAEVAALGAIAGFYTGCESLAKRGVAALKEAGREDHRAFAEARDAVGEAIGVATLIEAAVRTGARAVVRQSSTERVFELLRRAKKGAEGFLIGVEVTPHHLHLDVRVMDSLGPFALMLPPLRSPTDCRAAVAALKDGTVDFVGSDHAPHAPEEKSAGTAWTTPGGTPGLETISAAILDLACRGEIPFSLVAEVLSTRPAQMFGIAGRKGALSPGADGDLVLIDSGLVRTVTQESIISKAKRSPFEGVSLRGWPVLTVLSGQVIAEDGKLVASEPSGRFVARSDVEHQTR